MNRSRWLLGGAPIGAALIGLGVLSLASNAGPVALRPKATKTTTTKKATTSPTAVAAASPSWSPAVQAGQAAASAPRWAEQSCPSSGDSAIAVSNSQTLVDAVGAARPGDCIRLAPGTYEVSVELARSGTPAQPIVIDGGGKARLTGKTRFEVTGDDWVLQGLVFEDVTNNEAIVQRTTASGLRVTSSVFNNVGDGVGGCCTGIIVISNETLTYDQVEAAVTLQALPAFDANTTIDGNTFRSPRNVPIRVDHKRAHWRISRNLIVGPPQYEGETMAMKFGVATGRGDCADGLVDYNSIIGYSGANSGAGSLPYTLGTKMSCVEIRRNFLSEGRITIRSGDHVSLIENVIANGDLELMGDHHRVLRNYVRTRSSRYGDGVLQLLSRHHGVVDGIHFDCVAAPCFYDEFRDSLVEGNKFVADDTYQLVQVGVRNTDDGSFASVSPPTGIQFLRNEFVFTANSRSSPQGIFTGSAALGANGNSWVSNTFVCELRCSAGRFDDGFDPTANVGSSRLNVRSKTEKSMSFPNTAPEVGVRLPSSAAKP